MRTRPGADDAELTPDEELTAPLPRIRERYPEGETEYEAEAGHEAAADDADERPLRRRGTKAAPDRTLRLPVRRPSRPASIVLGSALALVVLLIGLWAVPPVQTVLR